MSSAVLTQDTRAVGRGRPGVRWTLTRGPSLGLGIGMLWFSLLVLIPLAAIVATAGEGGWSGYVDTLTNQQSWAAIKLTVGQSLLVTAVNVVMGTVIAWVLVRDRFWGKRLLDLMIDIPFAMPTVVAGLVLLSLYGPKSPVGVNVSNTRTSVTLALAFVTLPFIVRTVQPVLAELDADV
jgi:sulfate/thiosulfate transport system permease protein